MLVYRTPAKINLSLDILARREDGYHELQSVVHCIGLFDTISLDMTGSAGLSFRCSDPNLSGDDNLCLQAARAWFQAAKSLEGKRSYFPGVRITLDKKIPVGAGLGGGSGNAAATLLALNEYSDSPLPESQLHEIAATLGADVPLFLKGGCALLEGIGERLSTLPSLDGWVVLICPDQHASTPAVYRRFDEMNADSQRSTPAMLEAVRARNLKMVGAHLKNDLQMAAQSLGIDAQLPMKLLKKHGAIGACLSGSGAASFGLFASQNEAGAVEENLKTNEELTANYRVFVAPLIKIGCERAQS